MSLITAPNIADQDGFYAELLQTHEGLSEAEGHRLNARLILILANHVGDARVLSQALRLARETGGAGASAPDPAP